MKFKPYPYQDVATHHAVDFLRNAAPTQRLLYAAPTGCGKSVVELCVQEALHNNWIVTPRDEIIHGMMDKLGATGDPMDHRIATPVKLRNRLMDGKYRPASLTFDEGHHHEAETWQQLDLLTGFAPCIAYTATPYRGTPRGTRDFLERWGKPAWLITYEEAVAEGYISMPTFEVLPLVDDDIVDVMNGEFSVTSIDSATVDRMGDMAEHARKWHSGGYWDRPTIFALPSTLSCERLQREFLARGLPIAVVNATTPRADRQTIFQAVRECIVALAHINIVSEGVDLPLRRYVDLAPTLSPVNWVQKLGRITRRVAEGELPPAYVCTNRNIMRHAYTLEGVVPLGAVAESEKKFPTTQRAHSRVLGLEAIGRFKPVATKLVSGLNAYTYALSVYMDGVVVEYCTIVHPAAADPVWARKLNATVDGVRKYGSWEACEPPADLRGFSSVPPRELSPKQKQWWDRCAARHGLDQTQDVTRKSFQALPVLSDLGLVLQ